MNPFASTRPPSSSGLGRRPFTAVARVQIPLGVLANFTICKAKFDDIEFTSVDSNKAP